SGPHNGLTAGTAAARPVALVDHPAALVGEGDRERPAVLELQDERDTDKGAERGSPGDIDRALDAVHARNRHARAFEHSLVTADAVRDALQPLTVANQVPDPGALLHQLQNPALHGSIVRNAAADGVWHVRAGGGCGDVR